MSGASVAILIASLSALFTGMNMFASWATYRRAHPHVTLRPVINSSSRSIPGSDVTYFMTVHVRNKGQNSFHLTNEASIEMRPTKAIWRKRMLLHPWKWRTVRRLRNGPYTYCQLTLEGDVSQGVPGFNGAQWKTSFSLKRPETEEEWRQWKEREWCGRVSVCLPDSSSVASDWFRLDPFFTVGFTDLDS